MTHVSSTGNFYRVIGGWLPNTHEATCTYGVAEEFQTAKTYVLDGGFVWDNMLLVYTKGNQWMAIVPEYAIVPE